MTEKNFVFVCAFAFLAVIPHMYTIIAVSPFTSGYPTRIPLQVALSHHLAPPLLPKCSEIVSKLLKLCIVLFGCCFGCVC